MATWQKTDDRRLQIRLLTEGMQSGTEADVRVSKLRL